MTAYTIAIVQNSQALQYDKMHAALQTARNQSSLETPLRAEELLTAHFNLAVLEDQTITDTSPDAKKSPDNTQDTDPSASVPDDQTYVKIPSRYAENSATRRPHPTGAVTPTCRREYGLVNAIPAGYESDDSWDNLSHTHDHTQMHNIVPLLTLRPWRNSPRRAPEQQQFRQQRTTNCKSMPLVRCGLTLLVFLVVWHRNKIMLLFGSVAPIKHKGARGEVHSRRPRYYVPCSI